MNVPTPADELAGRVVDFSPVALLSRLAMTQNLKDTMADHRRRVNNSHRAQMRAAGLEDIVTDSAGKDDDMGDTIVARDIVMQAPPQPQAATPKGLSALTKAGVGAAILLGGAGAGIIANELLKDQTPAPPAVTDTDTDTDTWKHVDFGIETK
jgi:hypothetical protein